MANSKAGSSRPKIQLRDSKRLMQEELELLLSSSEDEFAGDGNEIYGNSEAYTQFSGSEDSDSEIDYSGDALDPPANSWGDQMDIKHIPFSKTRGLLVQPAENGSPIHYFFLIADENFFNLLLDETNKQAEVIFLSGANVKSRITSWKPLTLLELHKFVGLLLHMGTIKLDRLNDYWNTDRLFDLKCFAEHMSRDRFLLILRCLHFSSNPVRDENMQVDRLHKIKPVLDFFNNKMLEIYQPGKQLSLGEPMVLWRGRLVFRQYVKNRRHKYGVKLYMLREPNGIILNANVHIGALDIISEQGLTTKVVHLMKDRFESGHTLYMDNFYNSYNLAIELLKKGTYCTGPLPAARLGNPTDIVKAKLAKGETRGKYREGVLIGKWRDKQDVLYISTEFSNDMVDITNTRNEVVRKPLPVVRYNECMNRIDHQDQMMAYYPNSRKTLRWYKKLGVHFLQLMLLNAHLLHSQYCNKMTFYEFRLEVIRSLLNIDKEKIKRLPKRKIEHVIQKILVKNTKGETKRKRCTMCSRNKIRKSTLYHCEQCPNKPGLCVGECFVHYHSN